MRPRKTILCVENNEQMLSVRKFMLETRGYRVVALSHPQAALEFLQQSLPGGVDLLLADLVLPAMDGNELARRAKAMHPGLPTLLIASAGASFERLGAADAFVPKNACTAAEILERVRVLVMRKRGPKKHAPSLGVAVAV